MTSLWLDHPPQIPTDPFTAEIRFDEVIVGAGITGLVAAVLFARQGHKVAVVEAARVGNGTTGHTTAKVTQLQGIQLSKVARAGYPAIVKAYAESNHIAFDWLMDYLDQSGVPVERRDAYTYSTTEQGAKRVDKEWSAARSVGLDVERLRSAPLPFATTAAVRLRNQAQIDPLDLLAALAAEFRSLGGVIFESTRVTGVRATEPAQVRTSRGTLNANRVIVATGMPILDRGLYFAKVMPTRSYAQAFEIDPAALPVGMFLSADQPTRSIRTSGGLLLTGGNGHGVGRHRSEQAQVDDLTAWTQLYWPGATLTNAWSAQDYTSPHHVPFVGWMPRGRGRIFLATGYDKWGMTNGVAAALTLVADVLGSQQPWQKTLHHRITTPVAFAAGIGANAATAWWYAKGYARAIATTIPSEAPAEGSGAIGRDKTALRAVSTVAGVTCSLSAVCPHLGAIVNWNDAEKSWDCPAHGSRFAADGTRLEGPASRDLRS
ncbi:MAG TPA: FAD-dependent oxidoreductase [Glaciihabitans sp.]|jgi:glycine/D-amino acid oxidase-like deaminating enzyme/nitrite reductase/ring-hydroxylating ferredoxin subunit|nr:FAD-dependent oxidoreductase [Glaciihabitans sp.]